MKDHSGTCHDPNTDAAATVVVQGFGQFYKCAKFSDITLVDAAGKRSAAHRLVLSAGSRKFNEMLSQDVAEEIYCNDVEPACLHAMLQYLYTNRCNIQMHNAVQLLSAAVLYGCDELESTASLYIHMQLNAHTCCFFFAEAQKHKVEHIAIKSLYLASLDYQNVIDSPGFYDLSLENLTAMLGSPKLGAISKHTLYKAAYLWIAKDPSRFAHFKDVLICIQSRPPTQSDELHLLRFLNAADGRSPVPIHHESREDMEWTSTAATTTTVSGVPFESKRSDDLPSDKQTSSNALSLTALDLLPTHMFSKDSTKTDEKEASTDASLQTNALCGSLFAHHLKKNEPRSKSIGEESVKARSTEDNVSSETSCTRKPKSKRGRGRKGSGKPSQPYTCQVEGCTASLQGLKEYHIRYKICQEHLKVSSITKDGQQQRFCQQCGRFHYLSEFDNNKRSCRTRLQRHNLRRRKRLNGSSKATNQTSYLSMTSVGIPSQQLVYLPTVRDVNAHSANVEKLYGDGRSRCVQYLPQSDVNPCLMYSPVPQSIERDPPQQSLERAQSTNETNTTCATYGSCYVKPDPGTGRLGGKSGL